MSTLGRFAPSPSGELHLGNLRTAMIAWLTARSVGGGFLLRIEDLDSERCSPVHEKGQIADLQAIGLTWDADPIRQSERLARYREVLDSLSRDGHTYECFCTRREIREAQSAPHADAGRYPGTCRELTTAQREALRARGRPPTIRLRGDRHPRSWTDGVLGRQSGVADDVVLARWDGAIGYNLAVVVDDLWQGINHIVRGDDLADQTATQQQLMELLGASPETITFTHVPLVLNQDGKRLAKRDGAVTLSALRERGHDADAVVRRLLDSLGGAVHDRSSLSAAAERFDLAAVPRAPWVFQSPTEPPSA